MMNEDLILRNVESPWERMSDETQKAYAAFSIYLKMPPHRRSLRNGVLEFKGTVDLSVVRMWATWSSKYNWVYRSGKWDEYCEEEERRAHIQGIKEMRTRHLKVAQALFTNGVQRLKLMGPEEIKLLTLDDMFKLLTKGYVMERETMGVNVSEMEVWEADKRIEKLTTDEDDFAELTTSELRHYLVQHRKINIPGTNPTLPTENENTE